MKSLTDPAHKIDRQFDALAHYKKHGWSYPLSAEIDLTSHCALNCFMCHSKHMHNPSELSEVDIVHILGQLAAYGCKSVTYSGGGDPLESPHWKYAILSAKLYGMDIGLYSYLPKFDQEKADFLGKQLSFCYSHSVSTKGLKRPEGKCTWSYGILLDSTNWHKVSELVEKVDLDFFHYVDIRPICPVNAVNSPLPDYSWVERAIEVMENTIVWNKQVKFADYKFYALLRKDKGRDYQACYSTDFTTCIGSNGDVFECVNRRNITTLGNILKESLSDIWKRKHHVRTDMSECRILCRNNGCNQTLYKLLGPEPQHSSFI